jgi:hypothetical protein
MKGVSKMNYLDFRERAEKAGTGAALLTIVGGVEYCLGTFGPEEDYEEVLRRSFHAALNTALAKKYISQDAYSRLMPGIVYTGVTAGEMNVSKNNAL